MRLNKWTSILSGSDWENSIDKETLATSNIVQYKLETDTHLFEIMCAEKPAIKRLTELEIEMGGIKRQKKMDVYHSPEEKEKISRFHENLKKDPKSNQN